MLAGLGLFAGFTERLALADGIEITSHSDNLPVVARGGEPTGRALHSLASGAGVGDVRVCEAPLVFVVRRSVNSGGSAGTGADRDTSLFAMTTTLLRSNGFRRIAILTLALATAGGVAACGSDPGPAPTAGDPAVEAQAAPPDEPEEAAADPGEAHRPGFSLLQQVEALDLRPEQRVAVDGIRDRLRADLVPSREAARGLAEVVASGLEAGRIDHQALDAQRAVLASAAAGVTAAAQRAANDLHATLDPEQRAELVLTLRARHDDAKLERGGREREHWKKHGPLSKLARELGLSEDQKQSLADGVRRAVEELFPNKKQRRLEMEARMAALGDAFMSDDFDAAKLDFGKEGVEMAKGMSTGAVVVAELAVRVLTSEQRARAAARIRERAAQL